ncbi:hypothetical protein DMENIID0001_110840 [Sergentomyia squamirostris]
MTRFYESNITNYMAAFTSITQLFVLCFFGQIVKSRTQVIAGAFYMTKWYEMPLKEQKNLIIAMAVSQRPVNLEAGGIMDLTYETFASIIKAAVTYGAMLFTVLE